MKDSSRGLLRLRSRAVLLSLAAAALLLGGAWLLRGGNGSDRKPRIQFPPAPRLEAAIAAAQERLKADPQDLGALLELGILHFEKGREYYPEAINELEEARELGALDARIFYCLGTMYQEAGLYPFALEEYRRFLRHHPDDKEVRLLAAKLLYQQGQFAEAVSHYERLKYHFPEDSLIEENLGLSLWGAKAAERALESFSQLKAMGPKQARRAEFYIGQIYYERGEFPAALEHLQKSLPEEGASAGIPPEKIHAALALTYQKLSQPRQAKASWEKVLALAPGDPKALAALRELNRRFPPKKQPRTRT